MILYYIRLAFRNLFRNRRFALINTTGLALALASCLLIMSYVIHEFSFENMHPNRERIFRVGIILKMGSSQIANSAVSAAIGPWLESSVPEVETAARFTARADALIKYNQREWIEDRIFFTEPQSWHIFSFPLLRGDPKTVLSEPFTVVIDEELARTHFAGHDPIGESIRLSKDQDFRITGIMKKIPSNTQFHCRIMASYSTLARTESKEFGPAATSWGIGKAYTYILLKKGSDSQGVERKLAQQIAAHSKSGSEKKSLFLQPFTSIYLSSQLSNELSPQGDLKTLYLFSIIALFILFIAVINFINISISRLGGKLKEIGVRKTMGAFRWQLFSQFMCESMVLTTLSIILGLMVSHLARPAMVSFLARPFTFNFLHNPWMLVSIILIAIILGGVAGAYPALLLSRLPSVSVLKPQPVSWISKSGLRRGLMVIQFSAALFLLFNTFLVLKQIHYSKNKHLGFDKSNLLVLNFFSDSREAKLSVLKNEILNLGISRSISGLWLFPGGQNRALGLFRSADSKQEKEEMIQILATDSDFLETFHIPLLMGRNLEESTARSESKSILINESAVKKFGLKNPLGHRFFQGEKEYQVIGVVKDFHTNSLHSPILPLIVICNPHNCFSLVVKLKPEQKARAIAQIEALWKKVSPGQAFSYGFGDEIIGRGYSQEEKLAQILSVFSGLAILISCLGVFGLASSSTEQRTKEIAIRKTLGASVPRLVGLLSNSFMVWIVLAEAIAWPLAYFTVSRWLRNFTYRVPIGIDAFLISGFIILLCSATAVSFHTIRAARANPVDSLRYE